MLFKKKEENIRISDFYYHNQVIINSYDKVGDDCGVS